MKIHLERSPRSHFGACGLLSPVQTWNPREVTCSRCKGTMEYLQAITEPPTTTTEER